MASTYNFHRFAPPEDGSFPSDARAYWIRRATAELRMAQRTPDARAKLAHYELSGLYSIKARLTPSGEDEPPSRPITWFGAADICSPAQGNRVRPATRAGKPETVTLNEVDTIVLVNVPEMVALATEALDPAASIITIQARRE